METREYWWVKEAEKRIMAMQNIKLAIAFVGLNILDAALIRASMMKGIGVAIVCALLLLLFATKYPRPIYRIFLALVGVMVGICIFNGMGLV